MTTSPGPGPVRGAQRGGEAVARRPEFECQTVGGPTERKSGTCDARATAYVDPRLIAKPNPTTVVTPGDRHEVSHLDAQSSETEGSRYG